MKIEETVKELNLNIFFIFSFILLASLFSSIYFENIFILGIPVAIIVAFFALFDYKCNINFNKLLNY